MDEPSAGESPWSCLRDGDDLLRGRRLHRRVAVPHADRAVERSSGTNWSVAARLHPSNAATSELDAISCPTSTSCFAVGNSTTGGAHQQALIERWNGKGWAFVAGPTISAGTSSALSGIACTSATNCLAVGNTKRASKTSALAERWDGKHWTVSPSAALAGALSGVACATGASCFAVGANKNVTLIERWNGKIWSRVAGPSPAHTTFLNLSGVSCPVVTSCFAVGSYVAGAEVPQRLIERWNGTNWSIVAGAGQSFGAMSGVSCRAATSCVAVSYFDPHVQRWDGTNWSVFRVGGSYSGLSKVSCASPTSCFAVGTYQDAETDHTTSLLQQWNGATWSVTPSAVLAAGDTAFLSDVSCNSSTNCFAVGSRVVDGTARLLVERWDGTSWSEVASADPAGSTQSGLTRVACVSDTSCFAVGSADAPFIEQWDGTSWTVVASPSVPGGQLTDISCQSATSCFATGYTETGSGFATPVIERWNGASWSVAPSPKVTDSSRLDGISCPSGGTTCLAVGTRFGDTTAPLVERWNGSNWSVVANPAAAVQYVSDVSCATDTSCFVISSSSPLVQQWDATKWTSARVPLPATAAYGGLEGISCMASTCLGVGSVTTPLESHFTLVERYS